MDLFNLEAEKSLLACIMTDGASQRSEEIIATLKITDFYYKANQEIFSAMFSIHMSGRTVDIVNLVDTLQRNEKTQLADIDYISSLTNTFISTANYKHWLGIVEDLSRLRLLERYGEYIKKQITSGKKANELIPEFEEHLTKIGNMQVKGDLKPIKEPVKIELARMEKAAQQEYDPFGLKTGFPLFDKSLWGLQKGNMIVLAARPGVGKTAFALNILNHAAVENKKNCLIFSIEMSETEIVRRLFCISGEIESYDILSGAAMKNYPDKTNSAGYKLSIDNLVIDDSTTITVPEMTLKAKKFKRRHGKIDLIVIDYLQKIMPSRSLNSRVAEVGEIARSIKNMARQLDVPVLVLCQPNRQIDKGKDGKPQEPALSDLRESGEIEQEADIVAFLKTDDNREAETKKIELQLAKFRNGQMKTFEFEYIGKMFKFKETGIKNILFKEERKQKKESLYNDGLVAVGNDDLGF